MWLAVVFLAGHLAGALAWLTVSTEEAPDLLATAPVRRRDVLWAKLQAALVPTAVIAAVPVAIAFYGRVARLHDPGVQRRQRAQHLAAARALPRSAKRSEIGWRGNSNKMLGIVEMGSA